MESIVSTFHIDWKIILAQAANFGIVLLVFYLFAFKPLGRLMKDRSQKIEKGVEDARSNAELLEKTKAKYEEALTQARREAQAIFEAGKSEAESKKALMLEVAQKEAEKLVQSTREKLKEEKTKMVAEAKREIVTLTLETTEKLLDKKLDHSYYDEKTIKELAGL